MMKRLEGLARSAGMELDMQIVRINSTTSFASILRVQKRPRRCERWECGPFVISSSIIPNDGAEHRVDAVFANGIFVVTLDGRQVDRIVAATDARRAARIPRHARIG